MDLQMAIKVRRTIHSFNTKKVPEDIINRAIEAANYAPCHRLSFPWRFTNIIRSQRELLARLALEIKCDGKKMNNDFEEKVNSNILSPSHLIVASQISTKDQKRRLEDYAACSCAIQNLLLSLAGDEVGSKWSTGRITMHENTYKIVDIDPKVEEIIGFIWVGYGIIPTQINRPLITSIYRSNESSNKN